MEQMGLLFVISEPPAAFEEELNEWYEREHIPERAAIPGFLSALRFNSAARPRRYLALYDLESHDVLSTPAYLAFSGDNFTPWTKRVVSTAAFTRLAAVRRTPGRAVTSRSSSLLVLRFVEGDEAMFAAVAKGASVSFEGSPLVVQSRLFECRGADAGSCLLIVEGHGDLQAMIDFTAFGPALPHLDLIETFLPRR